MKASYRCAYCSINIRRHSIEIGRPALALELPEQSVIVQQFQPRGAVTVDLIGKYILVLDVLIFGWGFAKIYHGLGWSAV